jgi:hypothetical protein
MVDRAASGADAGQHKSRIDSRIDYFFFPADVTELKKHVCRADRLQQYFGWPARRQCDSRVLIALHSLVILGRRGAESPTSASATTRICSNKSELWVFQEKVTGNLAQRLATSSPGLQPNRAVRAKCGPLLAEQTRARAEDWAVQERGGRGTRSRWGGRCRRRRAGAAAGGGDRGPRQDRGAFQEVGGTPRCWRGEQAGAAGQPGRRRR